MPIMALDHTALFLSSWPHGTGKHEEKAGAMVYGWSPLVGYVNRTLSHLCAPGFAFVLGIGLVYFTQSRERLGWTAWRITQHFIARAIALTLVSVVIGLVLSGGQTWFQNLILWALAMDYLICGVLYLFLARSESVLTDTILSSLSTAKANIETQPLLESNAGETDDPTKREARAAAMSWHIHNGFLLALVVVTIWWNIWLSPNHGYCTAEDSTANIGSSLAFRIWFFPTQSTHILSQFPPMAWISFAILGLLYGRVVTARTWKQKTLSFATGSMGILFSLIIIATRLLRTGNLSENCLHTSAQLDTERNPYLDSAKSFFYIIKYPPDVAFWALTTGGNLIILAVFEAIPARLASRSTILLAFGTSALFFYVVHLFLLLALSTVEVAIFGHDTGITDPNTGDPVFGVDSLWGFWGTWGLAMMIMYPLCNWYDRFKRGTAADSIWRLF